MLKKTITYTDWNGVERTEDFYFNLSRVELVELEFSIGPGKSLSDSIKSLMNANDMGTVIKLIKDIILTSYGEKSPDGKRFIKNQEIRDSFEQNPAFDVLYMDLATNAEATAEFVAGIIPAAIRSELGDNPEKNLLDRMTNLADANNVHLVK